MTFRNWLFSALIISSLSGCAGRELAINTGATARGEAFLEVGEVHQHRGMALHAPQLTVVADPDCCGLQLFTEPDAWLVTWFDRADEARRPRFLRVEREDTEHRLVQRLRVRQLESDEDTTLLEPGLDSEDWPWRKGDTVYTGSALLAVRSDGVVWFGRRSLAADVARARDGFDEAR